MAFYVWDTPEVAKSFNVGYSSKYHFYVSTDGTRNTVYKDDSRTFIGKSSIEQMKLLGIPEYKLHPVHGLIPADSKLFLENHVHSDKPTDKMKTKEENENMSENKDKTLKVGDLAKVKNPNKFELAEDVAGCVGKKFLIVAMFNYGGTDFVVVEHPTQHSGFVTIPLELCYPVPTHKEMTLDKMKEVCSYKGSWSSLYQQFASDLYDAGLRFKDDVE